MDEPKEINDDQKGTDESFADKVRDYRTKNISASGDQLKFSQESN